MRRKIPRIGETVLINERREIEMQMRMPRGCVTGRCDTTFFFLRAIYNAPAVVNTEIQTSGEEDGEKKKETEGLL